MVFDALLGLSMERIAAVVHTDVDKKKYIKEIEIQLSTSSIVCRIDLYLFIYFPYQNTEN